MTNKEEALRPYYELGRAVFLIRCFVEEDADHIVIAMARQWLAEREQEQENQQ